MKLTVGISDMKTSRDPDDVILTHSISSCIGLVLYDPQGHIGALFGSQRVVELVLASV
ncbi:MAG: hypothetical protein L3K26_08330 [Candidatus Hydrogenedentes bacterium]|nr:hypothetical protein [Candidatus Hydrogenedentota bacterium]